jgi:hypothetical protein
MQPANVLKIESLSDGWRDKDDVILHSCFQLLKDFVEQEKEIIDWESDEGTKDAKFEIDFLYSWWTKRVDKENDLNKKQYEENNQMLMKLIRIRKYLWT